MTSALSYAGWGMLAAAGVALWVVSRRPASAPARPALVLRRLACGPLLRVALVGAWAFAGWHLFAR